MSHARRPDLYATYGLKPEYQKQDERVAALASLQSQLVATHQSTPPDPRTREADLLYLTGDLTQACREYKKAATFFNKALSLYQNLPDKKALADTYERLGDLHWPLKNPAWPHSRANNAPPYYRKALALYDPTEPACVDLMIKLVGAFLHRGGAAAANEFLTQASDWCQKNDYPGGKGPVFYSLAGLHLRMGYFTPAVTLYRQSIDAFKQHHVDATAVIKEIILTFLGERSWHQALSWCKELLDAAKKTGNVAASGFAYHQMGAAYYYLEELENSRAAYTDAVKIYTDIGDARLLMELHFDQGLTLQAAHEPAAAVSSYEKAIGYADTLHDHSLIAKTYYQLGLISQTQKNGPEAIGHFSRGIEALEKCNEIRIAALTWHRLAVSYETAGDLDNALLCFQNADGYYYKQDHETNGEVFYAIQRIKKKLGADRQNPT